MENAVYLSEALFDVINAIQRYTKIPAILQQICKRVILKLDYVQRLAVTECSFKKKTTISIVTDMEHCCIEKDNEGGHRMT